MNISSHRRRRSIKRELGHIRRNDGDDEDADEEKEKEKAPDTLV